MSRTYVGFKHIHLISQNSGKNFKKISGAFLFSLSVYFENATLSVIRSGVTAMAASFQPVNIINDVIVTAMAASFQPVNIINDVIVTAMAASFQPVNIINDVIVNAYCFSQIYISVHASSPV